MNNYLCKEVLNIKWNYQGYKFLIGSIEQASFITKPDAPMSENSPIVFTFVDLNETERNFKIRHSI